MDIIVIRYPVLSFKNEVVFSFTDKPTNRTNDQPFALQSRRTTSLNLGNPTTESSSAPQEFLFIFMSKIHCGATRFHISPTQSRINAFQLRLTEFHVQPWRSVGQCPKSRRTGTSRGVSEPFIASTFPSLLVLFSMEMSDVLQSC